MRVLLANQNRGKIWMNNNNNNNNNTNNNNNNNNYYYYCHYYYNYYNIIVTLIFITIVIMMWSIGDNSFLNCGCRWKWRMIIAINFQFKQLERRSLKKKTGFEPVTSALPVFCSTNWAMKPHIGSEVNLLSTMPVQSVRECCYPNRYKSKTIFVRSIKTEDIL